MSSLQDLPAAIVTFFNSINGHDTASLISTLTNDIIMNDEALDYHGKPHVAAWHDHALVARNASIEIKSVMTDGDKIGVTTTLGGDYKEEYNITEPFPLYCWFTLRGDLISYLRITDIAPGISTMRAAFVIKAKPNKPFEGFRNEFRPVPEVPKDWVKVKVVAAGLNYRDLYILCGFATNPLKFPLIMGTEGSGTLEDGSEVIIYPVLGPLQLDGKKPYVLSAEPTLDLGRSFMCELIHGTLAEYVVLPRENVIQKPKAMNHVTASVMGIAWLTAYRMLFGRSGLKKGDTMLVQGSAGGVATALIQLGVAAGMKVWTTGRNQEKRALAKQLGAERTFEPNEALPRRVNAVFNFSGGDAFLKALDDVEDAGAVVLCGTHSGKTVEVDLMKIHVRQIKIQGNILGTKEDMESLVQFVVEKGIQPVIDEVLPMEKIEEGLRRMEEGLVKGKLVIKVGDDAS